MVSINNKIIILVVLLIIQSSYQGYCVLHKRDVSADGSVSNQIGSNGLDGSVNGTFSLRDVNIE